MTKTERKQCKNTQNIFLNGFLNMRFLRSICQKQTSVYILKKQAEKEKAGKVNVLGYKNAVSYT